LADIIAGMCNGILAINKAISSVRFVFLADWFDKQQQWNATQVSSTEVQKSLRAVGDLLTDLVRLVLEIKRKGD